MWAGTSSRPLRVTLASRIRFGPSVQQHHRSASVAAVPVEIQSELPPALPRLPHGYGVDARRNDTAQPTLVDRFGRRHTYLRVSLTDRCNLRCQYCMPEEEEDFISPSEAGDLLTADELKRLMTVFVNMGVRKIRLTGGEPTVRRDFGQIIGDLGELNAGLAEPLSLGITTNGVRLSKFLPDLRRSGVRNINLSLDTLVAAKFPLLCRRPASWHERIMRLLDEFAAQEEHFRLKLNCVVLRGANEDEIGAFLDLTEHRSIEVRFLEFMPFAGNAWSTGRMVSQADITAAIQQHLQARGLPQAQRLPPDSLNDVARLWKVPGWCGRIGIIASMTDAFCGGCNRLRLTSDGQLRNCLFGEEGWNLRDELRSGQVDGLSALISSGVSRKFAKLGGKRDMHELRQRDVLNLPMVALGG